MKKRVFITSIIVLILVVIVSLPIWFHVVDVVKIKIKDVWRHV